MSQKPYMPDSQTLTSISASAVAPFNQALESHPIYQAIESLEDLRCFMQHHVYSVWDFMSLIKHLQGVVAPAQSPWVPRGDAAVRRFINELVLEEESDETPVEGQFSSHFELYLSAMEEIGADTTAIRAFVARVETQGIEVALQQASIPEASRRFTGTTFGFINSGQSHQVAAALALGREHIIPLIFRKILSRIGVSAEQAPVFHWYLNRHIHLDEDFHAPLSLRLLNQLCENDSVKVGQALTAADSAVQARLRFWDEVLAALQNRQTPASLCA